MLKNLTLVDFRNFSKKSIDVSSDLTIIAGANTTGKTTILEAIMLTCIGKSFRASLEREVIRNDLDVARVIAVVDENNHQDTIEVVVTTGMVLGKKTPYKKFLVNGVGKRSSQATGFVSAVLFWPEDLELIIGSPSIRRKYLDTVLCQASAEYDRASTRYEKALRIRNKLLFRKREGEQIKDDELVFWESELIENGTIIHDIRAQFIHAINEYESPVNSTAVFKLVYDHSIISRERFDKYAHVEAQTAKTVVGPHRDDFVVHKKTKGAKKTSLHKYGSRGEQRLGVLWLKIAELEYLTRAIGMRPILLLDDIFSELDKDHRHLVLDLIEKQQTIITTTDQDFIPRSIQKKSHIIVLD